MLDSHISVLISGGDLLDFDLNWVKCVKQKLLVAKNKIHLLNVLNDICPNLVEIYTFLCRLCLGLIVTSMLIQ